MWASKGEKLMGMSKMQQTCSAKIDMILTETKKSIKQRKEEFLDHVEKHFPKYFEEIYNNVEYRSMASEIMYVVKNITLKIVPPFLSDSVLFFLLDCMSDFGFSHLFPSSNF